MKLKSSVPSNTAVPTVNWDYVQSTEGIYKPHGVDGVRLVTLGSGGRENPTMVTLYVTDEAVEPADDDAWRRTQFTRREETLHVTIE